MSSSVPLSTSSVVELEEDYDKVAEGKKELAETPLEVVVVVGVAAVNWS